MRHLKALVLLAVAVSGSCTDDPAGTGSDAGSAPDACLPWSPERVDCYSGPAGTDGVGACRRGMTDACGALEGICENEVVPSEEGCDGIDNDCDGQVDEEIHAEVCDYADNDCDGDIDEGVRNACGECGECFVPGVHEPPIVACGGSAGGGPIESADAGPECDLPPSVCDHDWLIYWSNGVCVDGACRWEQSQLHCTQGCYDGGCQSSFT